MHRVYVASKLWHWEKWLKWEEKYVHDVMIISRWINVMRHHKTEDEVVRWTTPGYARRGWEMNYQDICTADVVIVYAEHDVLRGALIEIGMAIAEGKPIILVGNSPSYSEWVHLHNVIAQVNDFEDIVPHLNSWKTGW